MHIFRVIPSVFVYVVVKVSTIVKPKIIDQQNSKYLEYFKNGITYENCSKYLDHMRQNNKEMYYFLLFLCHVSVSFLVIMSIFTIKILKQSQ